MTLLGVEVFPETLPGVCEVRAIFIITLRCTHICTDDTKATVSKISGHLGKNEGNSTMLYSLSLEFTAVRLKFKTKQNSCTYEWA